MALFYFGASRRALNYRICSLTGFCTRDCHAPNRKNELGPVLRGRRASGFSTKWFLDDRGAFASGLRFFPQELNAHRKSGTTFSNQKCDGMLTICNPDRKAP